MENMLKKNLFKVISRNQYGFMKRRHMVENIIVVHEAIHSSGEKKDKGMIIKIDIANSFNRVRHSFCFYVSFKF
jgi:hypothetical protein